MGEGVSDVSDAGSDDATGDANDEAIHEAIDEAIEEANDGMVGMVDDDATGAAMNDTDELLGVARAALARAHSPYSRYPVGAAIRTASGEIYAGCNVENAAYPEGTCAEAGAIAAMVLGGEREIVAVAVVTEGETPGTPCGGCRQRLREFTAPDVLIHAATMAGATVTVSMADLLPESFGPDHLP